MLLDDISQASKQGYVVADQFTYSAVFNTLGANGTVTSATPIQVDSDFVIRAINLASYSAVGVPVPNPDYTIGLFDTGSGRQKQDAQIHVANLCGNAQLPGMLPEPMFVKGGSVVNVTLTNNTALAALVSVAFLGFKLFYFNGFTRDRLGVAR